VSRIATVVLPITVIVVLISASSCFSEAPQQSAPPVIVNNTTQGGDGGMTVALVVFAFLALALVAVAIVALMRLVERNRQCAEAEKARDRLADQLVSLGHLPAVNGYAYGYNARQALQAHVLASERQQELR
jgi:uncharacterized membrane protein